MQILKDFELHNEVEPQPWGAGDLLGKGPLGCRRGKPLLEEPGGDDALEAGVDRASYGCWHSQDSFALDMTVEP